MRCGSRPYYTTKIEFGDDLILIVPQRTRKSQGKGRNTLCQGRVAGGSGAKDERNACRSQLLAQCLENKGRSRSEIKRSSRIPFKADRGKTQIIQTGDS